MAAQPPYGYGDLTYTGAVKLVLTAWGKWAFRAGLLIIDGTINRIEARARGR